jgi:hypothetical protein
MLFCMHFEAWQLPLAHCSASSQAAPLARFAVHLRVVPSQNDVTSQSWDPVHVAPAASRLSHFEVAELQYASFTQLCGALAQSAPIAFRGTHVLLDGSQCKSLSSLSSQAAMTGRGELTSQVFPDAGGYFRITHVPVGASLFHAMQYARPSAERAHSPWALQSSPGFLVPA